MTKDKQGLFTYNYLIIMIMAGIQVTGFCQNNNKLYPIPKGDKYGLIDSHKKLIFGYDYDYISPFQHGIAITGYNRKYGMVNYLGTELIPLRFDSIQYESEGLYIARLNDSLNIIDTLGNPMLNEWYYKIIAGWDQIFMLIKSEKHGEEFIRNTIRHYNLENIIGLDHDSVLYGKLLFGYYSKKHLDLNGIWFSGGTEFSVGKAEVSISNHTYYIDTLGKITPRLPSFCDVTLMSIFIPDELPTFPGGKTAFNQFIKENLKYPTDTKGHYYKGKVEVRMLISETGQVNPIIIKSLNPEFDSTVIKAIWKMPKWNPAKFKGKSVCWYYDFTQGFTINGL
jgi:hypothetical protein